jgi:hypothetical protein
VRIEEYSFGRMIIDGKRYTSDLLIYPNGRVEDTWYRKKGHDLSLDDISTLIKAGPEIIIAGTGASGLMKPEKDLGKRLDQKGIYFISLPCIRAMEHYNVLSVEKSVGACFHLTC